MQLSLRRTEPRDVSAIVNLTKGAASAGKDDLEKTLKRRFGEHIDIEELVDTAPFSLVGTDPEDTTVLGFIAFSNGPRSAADDEIPETYSADPNATGIMARQDWDKWVRKFYDTKELQIHNTKFLSYFVADPDHSLAFLDAALTTTFTLIPSVRNIAYLLPETNTLFPPLTSTKYVPPPPVQESDPSPAAGGAKAKKPVAKAAPRKIGGRGRKKNAKYFVEVGTKSSNALFALHVCSRKDVVPVVKVRKARVEDCDDLVPMFKKQNLLEGKHADFFLAELLESKSEKIKTLVAEADGEVVGFMSLNRDVDQELLAETFHLEAFDLLCKLKESDFNHPTTNTSAPQSHTNLALTDSLPNSEPTLAETNPAFSPHSPATISTTTSRPVSAKTVTFATGHMMESMLNEYISEPEDAPRPPPQPTGPPPKPSPNAFCVTMFSMQDEYASQAIEFIRAAFPLFPDRDYCCVTVPTTAGESELLRGFVQVGEKAGRTASHCLYVTNRFGIQDPVQVRITNEEDIALVDNLITGLDIEVDLMTMYRASITKDPPSAYISYVAEHDGQLIGLVVLEKCADARNITDQFDVEEFASLRAHRVEGWPVLVRAVIVNPLFEGQARIQFPKNLRDGLPVPDPLRYNLRMLTTPLLYEPKIVVNTRIVVVGGSDTGISFLEKLVYNSHLHFSNLTLISTAGIPKKYDDSPLASRRCYTGLELQQLGLDTSIQIIRSSTTEFDRVLKRVRLSSGAFVAYDYLILTPGMQFNPDALMDGLGSVGGVFAVNPGVEDELGKAVDGAVGDFEEGRTVVYGRNLQAFAAIQFLLQKGLPPNRVIHVIPPITAASTCFNDLKVDEIVSKTIEDLGITTHRDSKLVDWETSQGVLSAIRIKSKSTRQPIFLENVTLFLYADVKSVAPDTFASINDSSLVFDGKLVIDKFYRTQDPFIYAAGTITKYSSKYQAKWSHEVCDSREVGAKLAELLLPLFDPMATPVEIVDDNELIKFEAAKKVKAVLPGDLHYFHFDKPRLPSHTLEWRKGFEGYGRDLVSTPPQDNPNSYFRIHIHPTGTIHSLTYLDRRPPPVDNYTCLYMTHERYLNRFVGRYDEGIVGDFVGFLNQPWALPLYHPRFEEFTKQVREQMLTVPDEEMEEIVESLKVRAKDKSLISEEEKKDLYQAFDISGSRKAFDKRVFDFLMECDLYESFP
ncbi:hypothetical protein HK097_006189 [Rhizophlyctis rosea]|uniref:Cilia- and flagella-associated protein 61 N-terminal domain-containing protein n=1 Tax=Rhizophlyctis rosea TaxID=64517 RepID=A0AAD5X587_9FUNG|nr:hypothetical protein HK097_006189 [Rhizophlyctis rosea]